MKILKVIILEGKLIFSDKEENEIPINILNNPEKLRPLLSRQCWQVFEKLAEKPSFPAELSKELGLSEQKVYYYIKQMKISGLIDLERTEERNGALAKYYSTISNAFAIVANFDSTKTLSTQLKGSGKKVVKLEFLSEFSKKNIFSGKIVVGSPDPHGKFKARARDGHLSAEITSFIGANFLGYETPLVFLDTMVKDLKDENSNLLIIGGPLTNKLAEQVNVFLPIKFIPSGGNWVIKSKISGKEYNDDSIGVIEKIPHPYFKNKHIILIAGKRNSGTIAGIIALTKKTNQCSKPNNFDKKTNAKVVEGLDINGDGFIDEIEFKE
jgi:hypothetical protein